jgi:hypothetical protein
MAFASDGARTPLLTSTPSNALTLELPPAKTPELSVGTAGEAGADAALVPAALLPSTASLGTAIAGTAATASNKEVHDHFRSLNIEFFLLFSSRRLS